MKLFGKVCAGLLAGAAPAGLQAQEAASSTASVESVAGSQATAREPLEQPAVESISVQPGSDTGRAGPKFEFRDADGKPLPPEAQRQLAEQLKDSLPPAAGQAAGSGRDSNQDAGAAGAEVVVSATRPRGSVIGDIPPERTFRALDLKAFGTNDIEELLETLGPQVSSNRGREDRSPVVLLNGRRVSSLAEISKIPTEAIERMEVFPEEQALAYGYPADQKVVNVVLFESFSSTVALATFTASTDGGRETPGASANYLLVKGDIRLNFDGEYSRSGALLESERPVALAPGSPDLRDFRTLLPETERFALNATVSGHLLENISSTLNGSFESSTSKSLFGLGPTGPLAGETKTRIAHVGTTQSGRLGSWQWTFTGNYDRAGIETVIDTGQAGRTRNRARSVNAVVDANLVLSGTLLDLPAGPMSTSVRAGFDLRDFSSRSVVNGNEQRFDLSRDGGTIQASLDMPIASRLKDEMAWLGTLSVNANLRLERLSGFGTLRTFGYGLSWSPIPSIDFIASATHEEGAPTVEQLGGPVIVTPNVATFDFTRRETVDVTRTFGGNPNLRSDDRHVISLGLTARPLARTDFTISVDYLRTRIDDPIAAFPIATPAIAAAFPERFTRDPGGRLAGIDARPLNFERSDQEQVRFGLNFTRPLGAVPPELRDVKVRLVQSEADIQKRLPPGAKIVTAAPGSPAARRAENLTSRLYVSLYYTLRLEDEILLREGGPTLDLLNGSAVDMRGGQPRHEIELQAGASKRGLGARLSATWRSGTDVSGLAGSAGDLRFSDYGTVNLNLFADLAERFGGPEAPDWLKGTRLSLGIVNLFNDRPKVRDRAGAIPINYQGDYLNPIGRTVSISLRKVF